MSKVQTFSTPISDVEFTAIFREGLVTTISDSFTELVNAYPNPTNDFLVLGNVADSKICMYDLQGGIIDQWVTSTHENTLRINVSTYADASFIRITNKHGVKVMKIIVGN